MKSAARLLVPGLLGGLLLISGGKPALPSGPQLPADGAGDTLEIKADGLSIQPGARLNYLRFGPAVRISGQGFSLEAETVELDVAAQGIVDTSSMQLPKLEGPPERVIADPGQAMQQMARDIRGPSAKLRPSAVKRIAASGNVRISGPGVSLSTATLYSLDGGESWSAGQSRIVLDDKQRGQRGSFSADLISFSVDGQTLLARGNLRGTLQQPKQDAVELSAGELRADLKRSTATLSGGLSLKMGSISLTTDRSAPPAELDLNSKTVRLSGGFSLADGSQGLELSGDGLSGSLAGGQSVDVAGAVRLTDRTRGLLLTAGKLSAVLEPLRLDASGKVHLEYGKSSYDAEAAVVTRHGAGKNAKYIVEMNGPQRGRIDVTELQQETAASTASD